MLGVLLPRRVGVTFLRSFPPAPSVVAVLSAPGAVVAPPVARSRLLSLNQRFYEELLY